MLTKTDGQPAAKPIPERMQRRILSAILKDARKFAQCRSFLTPDIFKDAVTSDIYAAAANVWDRTHEVASRDALLDIFDGRDVHRQMVRRVFKMKVLDAKYSIERIARFAKNRALKQAILYCGGLLKYNETGDDAHLADCGLLDTRTGKIKKGFETPMQIVMRANAVGTNAGNTGVFLSEALERIVHRTRHPRQRELLPTFIAALDKYGTGINRGGVGCILAESKGGKSHFLLNVAYGAACSGLNVLYVNMEIQEENLEDRFGRRIAGSGANQKEDPEQFIKKLQHRYNKLIKADIKLVRYNAGQATLSDVRGLLVQCEAEGFKPDVLIVDYLQIMRAEGQFDAERHRLDHLWVNFRGLCQEFNVYGWSAAQANRNGAKARIVKGVDLAECFSIKSHIDLGVSITRDEDDIENDTGKFFIFAARNDRDGVEVEFTADFSRSSFKVIEAEQKEEMDRKKGKKARDKMDSEQRADAQMCKIKANRGKPELPEQ